MGAAALYAHMIRSGMLDVLGEDYVRTARGKGLSERAVVIRHVLRSALTPIVIMGLDVSALLSGAIVVEQAFGLPGIGATAIEVIVNVDLPVVQGMVLFTACFVTRISRQDGTLAVRWVWVTPRQDCSG
jgi:peptide/nickel transport system permease protein